MGKILGHFFLPHPPAAIPEVGKKTAEQLKQTIEGFTAAAKTIAELQPDTIIVLTPHGPCFNDFFYMPSQKRISGDFAAFGNKRLILGFDNHTELAKHISDYVKNRGIRAGFVDDAVMKHRNIPYDLDHGVTVPLYFITAWYSDFKVLPIALPETNGKELYRFGILLREAIQKSTDNVVIIATGDLSHKVAPNSPLGYAEDGEAFDKCFKKTLLAEDVRGFLHFDRKLKENAAQCGLDTMRVLLGTLDGFTFLPRILSYEAPTGIGYLAAELTCGKPTESVFVHYLAEQEDTLKEEPFSLQLTRYAIEEYLCGEKDPGIPADTPEELLNNAGGVFVSLYNDGLLRGCAGTITPSCPNLAEEIMQSALWAATKDPFAAPVSRREVNDLTIVVDIICDLEEVTDRSELDPVKYGILVESRGKSAVILPDQPRIGSVKEQIRAAKEKAGIHPWHPVKIHRFTTTRSE